MSSIKNKSQHLDAHLKALEVERLVEKTGNIYEALAIIGRRARQVSVDLKKELAEKLEEFVEQTETIEEVQENKEQIEISRSYEKLPNPAIIGMHEFMTDQLHHRYKEEQASES
ncbi:MAG: DNA-directed RNA polymerase subunit omega [Saprospiraceae bacterium]|nr:DNA-directed RNA polymerase subunit omega [Saprospiraceae bacterium]